MERLRIAPGTCMRPEKLPQTRRCHSEPGYRITEGLPVIGEESVDDRADFLIADFRGGSTKIATVGASLSQGRS